MPGRRGGWPIGGLRFQTQIQTGGSRSGQPPAPAAHRWQGGLGHRSWPHVGNVEMRGGGLVFQAIDIQIVGVQRSLCAGGRRQSPPMAGQGPNPPGSGQKRRISNFHRWPRSSPLAPNLRRRGDFQRNGPCLGCWTFSWRRVPQIKRAIQTFGLDFARGDGHLFDCHQLIRGKKLDHRAPGPLLHRSRSLDPLHHGPPGLHFRTNDWNRL